jgi:hypothetical protein
METVDVLFPFKVWVGIVICTTIFSFVGTWIVVKKSRSLK